MRNLLTTLLVPFFLAVPMLRSVISRIGEKKENYAFGDSLCILPAVLQDHLCFYRIFMDGDHPDIIREGLFRIIDKMGKMGFANDSGYVVIKPEYDFVRPFNEGVAAFNIGGKKSVHENRMRIEGGKWGFINNKGMVVWSPVYDAVEDYSNGKVRVFIDNTPYILSDIPAEATEDSIN